MNAVRRLDHFDSELCNPLLQQIHCPRKFYIFILFSGIFFLFLGIQGTRPWYPGQYEIEGNARCRLNAIPVCLLFRKALKSRQPITGGDPFCVVMRSVIGDAMDSRGRQQSTRIDFLSRSLRGEKSKQVELALGTADSRQVHKKISQ